MMMLIGTVFLVQEENDQTDDAQAKAKNETREHGVPPRG
jgi:hypothetical protein